MVKTVRSSIPGYRCIWLFRHNERPIASVAGALAPKFTVTVEADYGDRCASSGYLRGTAWRRARHLADRVAATDARRGALQRGSPAGGGAVRTGAGTGQRDRVAGQRAVVR